MDAYLCREAYLSLSALSLISFNSKSNGLLIGHKRGPRFFVEKIFSSPAGFFPSFKNFHILNQLFEGKLLGFFSFRADEKRIKKILMPFSYGKLYLQINTNRQKKMDIESYIIDYENEFFLSPLTLKFHK